MKLRPDQERVKTLISDTLTLLCKNGLNYDSEFCVEALIGITLDKNQVFLVNIKETITKDAKRNNSSVKLRKRKPSEEKQSSLTVPNGNHSDSEYNTVKSRKIDGREHVTEVSVSGAVPKQLFRSSDVRTPESHSPNTFHANNEVVDLSEMSSEAEVHDLSIKDKDGNIVIKPDHDDESNEHQSVFESMQQPSAGADGTENIPPLEAIGSGPPVWPEPALSFAPGLSISNAVASPSISAMSSHDSPGQQQDWAITAGGSSQQSPGSAFIDASGKCACRVCGKSFRENWMVRRHMLTHSAANVACPHCDKRFKRKDTLKAHVDRSHQGMGYEKPNQPPTIQVETVYVKPTAVGRLPSLLNRAVNTNIQFQSKGSNKTAVKDISEFMDHFDLMNEPDPVDPCLRAQTIEEFEGTDGKPMEKGDSVQEHSSKSDSEIREVNLESPEKNPDISADGDIRDAYIGLGDLQSDGKDLEESIEGIEFVDEAPDHAML